MPNTPTICHSYVAAALYSIRQKSSDHYMDDILLTAQHLEKAHDAFTDMQQALAAAGLIISPEKV